MGHQRRRNILQNRTTTFEAGTSTNGIHRTTTGGRMTSEGQGTECVTQIGDRATGIVTGVVTFTVTKDPVTRIVTVVTRDTTVVRRLTNTGFDMTTILVIQERLLCHETTGKCFHEVRMDKARNAVQRGTVNIGCGTIRRFNRS